VNVLLVPAHPGFPGQIPQSRKTVVLCVCVDRGRFLVVHLCSTFSDCCQLVTPQDAEVDFSILRQNLQNLGFLPPESDRINRLRRNWHIRVDSG